MTKGETIQQYRNMSELDRHAIDRWLKANLAIGSLMAGVIVAMALASANWFGPEKAIADSPRAAISATSLENLSPFELMIVAPASLPIQQVDEPF